MPWQQSGKHLAGPVAELVAQLLQCGKCLEGGQHGCEHSPGSPRRTQHCNWRLTQCQTGARESPLGLVSMAGCWRKMHSGWRRCKLPFPRTSSREVERGPVVDARWSTPLLLRSPSGQLLLLSRHSSVCAVQLPARSLRCEPNFPKHRPPRMRLLRNATVPARG